jgi:hypothetical protein
MPIPRPSATPEGAVVVNLRATVPLDVKVNSRLAALPGWMMLENELRSTGVSDGEVIAASSQAQASSATQQSAAILILMDVSRGS